MMPWSEMLLATDLPLALAIALPLMGAAVGAVLGQWLAYTNTRRTKRAEDNREAMAAARLVDAEFGDMEHHLANALETLGFVPSTDVLVARHENTAGSDASANALIEMPALQDDAWQQVRLTLARHLSLREWDVLREAQTWAQALNANLERVRSPDHSASNGEQLTLSAHDLQVLDAVPLDAMEALVRVRKARKQCEQYATGLRPVQEPAARLRRRDHSLGLAAERFARALELLESSQVNVRIGALYALEQIALNAPRVHPAVIDVLCAYVRDRAQRVLPEAADDTGRGIAATIRPADIQAAITIIGRRNDSQDGVAMRLELSHTDLSNLNLAGANLRRADLSDTDLSYSDARGADLREATLARADLQYASLSSATLKGAVMTEADLGSADLSRANLTNADLRSARLRYSRLEEANLQGARLDGGDFRGADLGGANLDKAHIGSADLRETRTQATRWPHGYTPSNRKSE